MAFCMPMQRSLMNSTRSNAYYAIIASELRVVRATKYGWAVIYSTVLTLLQYFT